MSSLVKPNDKRGILVALASCVLLGAYPPAIRSAYADGANAVFILIFVTWMRTFMLAGFCLATGKAMLKTKEHRRLALSSGLWQALSVIGITVGLAYLPGPLVIIIMFTHTLMLLLFLVWKGEAKLDRLTLFSTLGALVGLVFVTDVWSKQPASNWIGIGLAFMAAIATMNRLYAFGHQMKKQNPAVVGAETFLVTSLIVLLTMLWKTPVPPASLGGWGWMISSSLSLGIGSFGMFYGIALLGSFRWSLFLKMEPVFTSIFSVLFLGEYLKASQYGGMALVLGSLVFYQLLGRRKAVQAEVVE